MMKTLGDVFAQSTDAVFGIDTTGMIRFVNSNFEQLTGAAGDRLCGRQCADVLCGTDLHGQPFCGAHCPIPKTVEGSPSINDFDLAVRRADGEYVLVNIGASYIPRRLRTEAGGVDVFFILRRTDPRRLLQRMAVKRSKDTTRPACNRLTPREREILDLATRGMTTGRIARRLSISTETIRSHFKNIYPKLGVNSRTEAVIYAIQKGLY